ncbi:hypothetical protein CRENBAI_015236 [Crenichthys baileyi]|uniref:PID domain-containing protein n=1 Tax=Crenichthys baileyi TaxID=28760 RepID=A0AAV9RDE1_9TELE
MDGLYFEVKPKGGEAQRQQSSEKARHNLTPNHHSCPSLSRFNSAAQSPQKCAGVWERAAPWRGQMEEEEIRYQLTMIGFRVVHHLTTMAMLPWVVAEICRSTKKDSVAGPHHSGGGGGPPSCNNKTVFLCVSASWVRSVSVLAERLLWDPLTHTVLFECRPHHVTKLIHNSQEPSIFACLVRDSLKCACYVFQCLDSTKSADLSLHLSSTCHEFPKAFVGAAELQLLR